MFKVFEERRSSQTSIAFTETCQTKHFLQAARTIDAALSGVSRNRFSQRIERVSSQRGVQVDCNYNRGSVVWDTFNTFFFRFVTLFKKTVTVFCATLRDPQKR